MNVSGRSMVIVIGFMAVIILFSGCVSFGGFTQVLNLEEDSGSFAELNKSDNGTYSVAGVSFKSPNNWLANIFYGDNVTSIFVINVNDSSSPQTQIEIDIIPNSQQEAINEAKMGTSIFTKKISSNAIVIDGNKAQDAIFLVNDPISGQIKFEQIYFVKSGKLI